MSAIIGAMESVPETPWAENGGRATRSGATLKPLTRGSFHGDKVPLPVGKVNATTKVMEASKTVAPANASIADWACKASWKQGGSLVGKAGHAGGELQKPKRTKSAREFLVDEMFQKALEDNPELKFNGDASKVRQLVRDESKTKWGEMNEESRKKYEDLSTADHERHETEMESFKKSNPDMFVAKKEKAVKVAEKKVADKKLAKGSRSKASGPSKKKKAKADKVEEEENDDEDSASGGSDSDSDNDSSGERDSDEEVDEAINVTAAADALMKIAGDAKVTAGKKTRGSPRVAAKTVTKTVTKTEAKKKSNSKVADKAADKAKASAQATKVVAKPTKVKAASKGIGKKAGKGGEAAKAEAVVETAKSTSKGKASKAKVVTEKATAGKRSRK